MNETHVAGASRYRSIFHPELFSQQRIWVTGGGSGIGRCIAHELASLGAQVLVENKPGFTGLLAMDAVAKAAPDGYTLGGCCSSRWSLRPTEHCGRLAGGWHSSHR